MIDPSEIMRNRPNVSKLLDTYSLSLLFETLQILMKQIFSSTDNTNSFMIGSNDDNEGYGNKKEKQVEEQIQILCDSLDYILSSAELYNYIFRTSSSSSSNIANSSSMVVDDTSPTLTPELLIQLVVRAAAYSPHPRVRIVAVRYLERLASGQIEFPKTIVFNYSLFYTQEICILLLSRLSDIDPIIAEHTANIIYALCGGKLLLERGVQPGIRREPRKSSTPNVSMENIQIILQELSFYAQYSIDNDLSIIENNNLSYSTIAITEELGITDIRIYTLIARLSGLSDSIFQLCIQYRLLDRILLSLIPYEGESTPNDPLLATNTITLLPPIARSSNGLDLLIKKHILHYLLLWAGTPENSAQINATTMEITAKNKELKNMDMFLGMFAIDALANIYAEACNHHYTAVSSLLHKAILPNLLHTAYLLCKDTSDETAPAAAMAVFDTVLGVDPYAIDVVLHNKHIYREWVELAVSSNKQLVGICYQSIANIIHNAKTVTLRTPSNATASTENTNTNNSSTSAVVDNTYARYHHLFEHIGKYCGNKDTIDLIALSLQDPTVPRTRYAAYDLLISIVELPGTWGIRKVFGAASLSNILLNRDSETTKEGKEWKYGIIVAALENPATATYGEEFLGKLQIYRDAGPYAAARIGPSVATESKTN